MADCKNCKSKRNEKKQTEVHTESVPYIVHEGAMARLERANKRLWITLLVLIIMLVGTNIGWLVYESQFEEVYQEVVQDAENGENNFIGGDSYGSADNQD